jgi:hypothetical protein
MRREFSSHGHEHLLTRFARRRKVMSERAVDLQIDVSGCNEDATTVIVEVSLRSLVEEYRLRIDDLAIAYPQIVSDERVMAD